MIDNFFKKIYTSKALKKSKISLKTNWDMPNPNKDLDASQIDLALGKYETYIEKNLEKSQNIRIDVYKCLYCNNMRCN